MPEPLLTAVTEAYANVSSVLLRAATDSLSSSSGPGSTPPLPDVPLSALDAFNMEFRAGDAELLRKINFFPTLHGMATKYDQYPSLTFLSRVFSMRCLCYIAAAG